MPSVKAKPLPQEHAREAIRARDVPLADRGTPSADPRRDIAPATGIARNGAPTAMSGAGSIPISSSLPDHGARRRVDGAEYIYFHGYWVRYYPPLADSLQSRKRLIDNLTRRAFHHTEPGINTPGERLDAARAAWEAESDPALKRVNAAMLAGALFNRATDIFTAIVELEEKGVRISRSNELMKACGDCFKEALELGRSVRHHSGEEGIDELWGEPFRAFTLPVASYYETRYIKVALTMANIDAISAILHATFADHARFGGIGPLIDDFAASARHECETMKSDACIFQIWPRFVAAGEVLGGFTPSRDETQGVECRFVMDEARHTLAVGRDLINWVARARVPMPRSTDDFKARCQALKGRMASC